MYISKIKSIKKIGKIETYDLNTPKYENFFLDNGILSHNSGKSTFLYKLLSNFEGFKPRKHIVYSRKECMQLLESQKFGFIFDDEAVRTAYKRNFQDPEQKILVQMLNMYRNNFNIYGMAIPKFYGLDKDLRDLIKIHIHIIRRGMGVIHMSRENILYSNDSWGVGVNQKIEEGWIEKQKKNSDFIVPYHKLSTFVGYIKFGDLSAKQRALYENIKETKRKKIYDEELNPNKDKNAKTLMLERLYERLLAGKLTKDSITNFAFCNNVAYQSIVNKLYELLKEDGEKPFSYYLNLGEEEIKNRLNTKRVFRRI